jgi:hypothetical protein
MKQLLIAAIAILYSVTVPAQEKQQPLSTLDPAKKVQTAEVSCGECQFKMKGKGCHLAVRIKGASYWVDGADVDSFGDAHDKTMGFCNKVRKAQVQGEVKNGRFQLSYLKFVDEKAGKS